MMRVRDGLVHARIMACVFCLMRSRASSRSLRDLMSACEATWQFSTPRMWRKAWVYSSGVCLRVARKPMRLVMFWLAGDAVIVVIVVVLVFEAEAAGGRSMARAAA